MTKKQNKIKEKSDLHDQGVDISNLSIPELAKKIENQNVDPKMVDKTILEKCAVYFRSRRGYKTADIAEILQVCCRTVERYIENVRSETSLAIGANFQNELLGEVLNNLRLRYDRLWRLSYSDKLSDYEKARIIFMCDQVEMNEIVLLGRLGYLSREQGLDNIKDMKEEMEEMKKKTKELVKKTTEFINFTAVEESSRRFQRQK